ncbi:serine/threonine-protein kinase [Micromonospora yangpuensis]|uniref:non-specific serine/threonine protein kinase n=1 Tax=Micromonospora yangpuensis TaxID=683228 RepID=A0A1C6U5U3_9ACTN|nr:serine/threonine-protein kinase [Micromonospora yangpuensis]SCL49440.1 Serine/threonine protein kinase [Micromonospora yangpuensis]
MTQIPTWSGGQVSPPNGRAAPGTTIGDRYSLRSPVGNGGMGTVWRANDTLLRRDVAVKEVILPPGLAPSDRDSMYERTLREARAAAAIQHPAVVQVYDVVTEGGRPWIVMELLDARSLADMVIEDGPVAPRAVAKIGIALLGALEVAHSIGVLHRDVKPANVLICTDGRCVLTDFGVARMPTDVQLTTPGMVLGSPHFISPERAMGQDFGPPSDLFSLGVTLYTAVEGRPPFDKGDPIETMHAVVEDPPATPSRSGPLTSVLMGLLEKDPARRTDVHTARATLRELLAGPLTSTATAVHSVTDPYAVVPVQRPVSPPAPAVATPEPKPSGQIGGRAMIGPGESLTDRLAELRRLGRPKKPAASAAALDETSADALAGPLHTPTGAMPAPGRTGSTDKPGGDDQAEATLRLGAGDRADAAGRSAAGAADATQAVPFGKRPQTTYGTNRSAGFGADAGAGAGESEATQRIGGQPEATQRIDAGGPEATQRISGGRADATQAVPAWGAPPGAGGRADATQAVPAWGAPAAGPPGGGYGGNQWSVPGTGQPWTTPAASSGTGGARGAGDRLVATVRALPRKVQLAAAGGLAVVLLIGAIVLFSGGDEEPVAPQAGPTPSAAPVGSDLELREHSARGVRVMVPKDWKRATGGSFVDYTDPEDSGRRVRIIVEDFRTTSVRWAEVAADGLRTRNTCAKPYNQLALDEKELAGKAAAELEYTCGEGDKRRHGVWRGVVHEGKAYSFYLTSGHDRFEESKPIFDEMVKSFQLTSAG